MAKVDYRPGEERPGEWSDKKNKLPSHSCSSGTGFPSPADDYMKTPIDLNEYLIKHQGSTFIVRAAGDSMTGAGIQSGDLLIVDRSLRPSHGKIVIAAINGELSVKMLSHLKDYDRPIDSDELELLIWGVVTYIIHKAT